MSKNPNNCPNCDHHKTQRVIEASDKEAQPLHCYMFKDAPTEQCMQHSGHKLSFFDVSPTGRILTSHNPPPHNFPVQTAIQEIVDALKERGAIIES